MRPSYGLLALLLALAYTGTGCSPAADKDLSQTRAARAFAPTDVEARKVQPEQATPGASRATEKSQAKAPARGKEKPPGGTRKLEGHRGEVSGLAFLQDGRQLLSASWDSTVRLWDLETRKERKRYRPEVDSQFYDMAVTKDGRKAVIGGFKTVTLLDVATMKPIHQFEHKKGMGDTSVDVKCVALSPDGRWALAGGLFDDQILYDAKGEYLPEFKKRAQKEVVQRNEVVLYDLETWKIVKRFKIDWQSRCYRLAFLPNGKEALLADFKDRVVLLDLRSGKKTREFPGRSHHHGGLAVSANGRHILVADDRTKGSVYLYEVETGKKVREFSLPKSVSVDNVNYFDCVAFSPNGTRACFAGRFRDDIDNPKQYTVVFLWDVQEWKELRRYQVADAGAGFGSVAFAPDGEAIAVGTRKGDIIALPIP